MNPEFRTKLRVKRWKLNEIQTAEILKRQQQPLNDYNQLQPQQIYPWPATSKCARCGIDRPLNAAMSYCCPHGNMCGIPMTAAPNGWPPYPSTISLGGQHSVVSSLKADIWN